MSLHATPAKPTRYARTLEDDARGTMRAQLNKAYAAVAPPVDLARAHYSVGRCLAGVANADELRRFDEAQRACPVAMSRAGATLDEKIADLRRDIAAAKRDAQRFAAPPDAGWELRPRVGSRVYRAGLRGFEPDTGEVVAVGDGRFQVRWDSGKTEWIADSAIGRGAVSVTRFGARR